MTEQPSTAPGSDERCDLLVHGACVITVDAGRRIHDPGAIAVRGTDIVAVGLESEVRGRFSADETIDAGGAVVHPGFIDAHNHIVHGTCRGVFANTERSGGLGVNFATWKAGVTAEDEYAASALAALELLHNGFTGFVEPGTAFDPEAIARAAREVGVRVTLADPYLWDQTEVIGGLARLGSPELFARAPASIERAMDLLGGELHRNDEAGGHVHGFVCLYGLGTASDALQRAAKAAADEQGVAFHQHEGYVPATTNALRARLGRSPVAHLADLGVLDESTSLIHMNVFDDEEAHILADTGASVVWCPVAYFNLGITADVACRVPALIERGVPLALGTDGARDCVVGDAALAAHLAMRSAGATLAPERVIEMQTIGAARAAGLADITGSLEPGKRADIVVREITAAGYPSVNPVHQLALTCRANTADTVLVNGRVVLRGGKSTRAEESEVLSRAKASVQERMRRLGLGGSGSWPIG